MRILALETSETAGSLAALDADRLIEQLPLDPQRRSAQTLAQGLDALWKRVGWQPRDVQLVAVTVGPGSFTGLRVGVTTAKILAYAVGAELLGVDTLEAIAQAAPAAVAELSAAVDAQRGQVVACRFRRAEDGWFQAVEPARLCDVSQWRAGLSAGVSVTGPVLRKLPAEVLAGLPVLDRELWFPQAQWVGKLAWRRYQQGQRDDPWTLLPRYSRLAAAEEKWSQRPEGRG